MKNILVQRIFGKSLPIKDENLIKYLARNVFRSCYFEKDIINNSWYLTVKNIDKLFDIMKYYEVIKNHKNYSSTNLLFSENFIQSEFGSKRRKIKVKENMKIKAIKLSNKCIENLFNSLLKLIDGTLVILFFKDKVKYKIEVDGDLLYNVHISDFTENVCIDYLIFVIEKWKEQNIDNYGGTFQKTYGIIKQNKEIIIKFTKKLNIVLKKKENENRGKI